MIKLGWGRLQIAALLFAGGAGAPYGSGDRQHGGAAAGVIAGRAGIRSCSGDPMARQEDVERANLMDTKVTHPAAVAEPVDPA